VAFHLRTRGEGAEPVAPEHFSAVHVAHPSKDLLIEQQLSDRTVGPLNPRPRLTFVGVGPQRVGAETRLDLIHLGRRNDLAYIWPTQVRHPAGVLDPQAHLAPDLLTFGTWQHREISDESEVHVQPLLPGELSEQKFAFGPGAEELPPGEQLRTRGETPLRTGDPHRIGGKSGAEI